MIGIGKLAGQPLVLGPLTLTTSQLYAGLAGVSFVLGIFASPIATMIWLAFVNLLVIGGHASLMTPPIESEFETVQQQV